MLVIITLSSIILILSYLVINLLLKVEKFEDISVKQSEFISQLQTVVSLSNDKLKEIDARGTFASDDEVGWFFKNLQEIQNELNTFKGDKNPLTNNE